MHSTQTLILAGLVCLSGLLYGSKAEAASATSSVEIQLPNEHEPRITRLTNGLTVLVLEDRRFPLVSTRLYVHAGSTYETPEEAGISHILEHMVFKGTDKRPKGLVAREVEAAGGYLNAATSFDYTVYLTDMPARHWKLGMDVVRDMAFHPMLDKAELESEKEVIVAELKRGKDTPRSRVFEAIQAGTLADTPYSRPIIGFEETIRGTTVEMLRAYINKYYQPQSMLLVVVGDIKADEVLAEAAAQFGGYANSHELPALPLYNAEQMLTTGNPPVTITSGPWNKVYLATAFAVPGMDDMRSNQLDLLAQLLGGDQTSFLWRHYKYDRQLVDSIRASNISFERLGILYISAELDAANVEEFWKSLTADLAALNADTFTDEDIARAKLNLEDDLYRAKETLSGLASKLGYFQFFLGNGALAEQNMINALRSLDRVQLQFAMDAWLAPDRQHTVILAPEKSLAELPNTETFSKIMHANWPGTQASNLTGDNRGVQQETEVIDLGSGRTLILIHDSTLPYVSADLSFSGGDALLTADQQGLASLVARTLTRGTSSRSATDMQTWLSDRASGLGASSGRQSFTVTLSAPSRFSNELLDMLNEVIREPAFADAEVEREKQSQIAAIRSREDQPLGLAFRRLPAFLFPGSVYGYYQQGLEDQVAQFTAGDIQAFWELQRKEPWVLAIAGHFDREAMIEAAKALPVPETKSTSPPAPEWGTDKALDLAMPGRQQAHYLMIFKTVPMEHEDAPALDLLQSILAGQSGLLFRDLRDENGLGYTVTAFNNNASGYGYMAFYIGTESDKIAEAEAGFARVLETLHTSLLPDEEINRGKNQMEGDYYRDRQSLGSRSGEAASLATLGKPLDFARAQIDRAATLDARDLQAVTRKYLNAEDAYIIQVLP